MNEDLIYRWLAAETRGRENEADEVLTELFAALPQPAPSAAFAERVLVGSGLVMSWRARVAIAACLLLCGLTAALLPLAAGAGRVSGLATPGELMSVLTQGLAALASRLDEAISLGRFLASLAQSAWLVLTAPPVALTLALLVAVAALAFRSLTELLDPTRYSHHVQAT